MPPRLLLWLLLVPQLLLVLVHQTLWVPVLAQEVRCGCAHLPSWQQLCHVGCGVSCPAYSRQHPCLLLLLQLLLLLLVFASRVQALLSCLLLQLLLLWTLRCCLLLQAWLLLLLLRSTAGGCWSQRCCWTAAFCLC